VFTLNNYSNVDEPREKCAAAAKYMVWQAERGVEGQTPHLQGYIMFNKTMTFTGVKKLMKEAHWEMRKGTHEQAKEYCMKEETRDSAAVNGGGPWTHGEDAQPGKRSDLLLLKAAVDEGRDELSIAQDDKLFPVWAGAYRAMERYKRLKTVRSRSWMTESIVYWGPPGTGKTRRAAYEAGADAYWLPKPGLGQTPFFDGYDGQETVVIDEFYGWLPFDLLCRMCDRYPLMVNTKGGMVSFYPRKILFTSNLDPNQWYKEGLRALERRFSLPNGRIEHMLGRMVGGLPQPWQPPAVGDGAPPARLLPPPPPGVFGPVAAQAYDSDLDD